MTFSSVSNADSVPSAPEVAYQWIKQYIVALPRESDAFLNEVTLANATETSRTPVREALLRLESEGMLRRIPRKGAYVPAITDSDVRALMDARALVESWAADAGGEWIRRDREVFQGLIDQQRDHRGDTERFIELDIRFHTRMIHAGGNPLLEDFYGSLRQRQLRVGVRAVSHGDDRQERVLEEHQAILDAISAGEDAAPTIRAHLDQTLLSVISA